MSADRKITLQFDTFYHYSIGDIKRIDPVQIARTRHVRGTDSTISVKIWILYVVLIKVIKRITSHTLGNVGIVLGRSRTIGARQPYGLTAVLYPDDMPVSSLFIGRRGFRWRDCISVSRSVMYTQ